MPITPFHPLIDTWFRERFQEPTDAQRLGWPEIAGGRNTLIAAPTGSGKTLAAFLVCIDRLLREALTGNLPDRTQVLYISPLKALSNDIRRNLEGPLGDIRAAAEAAELALPPIRALVRTGDTPAHERAAMLKKPPHILVTTPESLYLLLTSPKSRELLRSVNTVIVDEIHALARDKRGCHLMLSLERLAAICPQPPVRIGLSATQKPIEEIAHFLVGSGNRECHIVDTGHIRQLDLAIEVPPSDLSAVCSNDQWDEIYSVLCDRIQAHRSTLIFVNTRRMAERVSQRLRERLGEAVVASHHGSLSREIRLSAEERLKKGELKAIVATASLELGIDIGFIDLVCQIGSPRSIATFLQRVGRSGHHLGVIPKGRFFALTRDELIEGLALIRAVRQGRLDAVEIPVAPLDILEQQIVAEVAAQDWNEDDLYKLYCGAWPYRQLKRDEFDRIVALASEGVARGRREGAYLHRDQVHHILRARRAARLTALTCGGAIPESADYRVVTEGEGTFVGTVNEDFAIESQAGDVFLLGNTSWRIHYVRGGQVIVNDAQGAPASVPFWLGEAPGRTIELSAEVSRLRQDLADRSDDEAGSIAWLKAECGAEESEARQAVIYVGAQKAAVGMVPTQQQVLFERFFDESGGMQLVVHAPFGSRINRAWGLAMRKRFCRTFDFELQASADDNGVVLSLGPQHSFPLEEMFKMLSPTNAEDVLVQALLAAPMFQVRWRWNISRALAVLRFRGGKKVPPPLQRFKSDDLMTAVFPMQTACFEHRPPEIPIPDHPLVAQTIYDCLHEAMDLDRWTQVLADIQMGRIQLVAKDTREPSPFSHSLLNANPYAFLDDAPLEERRARAVAVRRTISAEDMRDLARLDPEAIRRVQNEAWPVVRDAEELHDTLLSLGVLAAIEGVSWKQWFEELVRQGRATLASIPTDQYKPPLGTVPTDQYNPPLGTVPNEQSSAFFVVAERSSLIQPVSPEAIAKPPLALSPELRQPHERAEAIDTLVRGRLEIAGPTTAEKITRELGLPLADVEGALVRLEAEGFAMRGRFTEASFQEGTVVEWCERRLLARIHRLTLEGARQRVRPVTPGTYWRFLSEFHHLTAENHREGALGVRETIAQLQGFELPAGAWENDILGSRVEKYQAQTLDQLSYSGELVWGRFRRSEKPEDAEPSGGRLNRVVPISLGLREDLCWLLPPSGSEMAAVQARPEALAVYAALKDHGAVFFNDLEQITGLLPSRLEDALSELAALGWVTADGFSAIRELVTHRKAPAGHWRARALVRGQGGRWTLFPGRRTEIKPEDRVSAWARQLLRRYGVVFRDLLTRESVAPSWFELVPVYRRMELRGDVRGGRFVSAVAGEQYALPEAVETLRRPREGDKEWVVISAADPLNLSGIITPGPRVPAVRGNRLLVHQGKLVAFLQTGEVQFLESFPPAIEEKIKRVLQFQLVPLREEVLKQLAEAVVLPQ